MNDTAYARLADAKAVVAVGLIIVPYGSKQLVHSFTNPTPKFFGAIAGHVRRVSRQSRSDSTLLKRLTDGLACSRVPKPHGTPPEYAVPLV